MFHFAFQQLGSHLLICNVIDSRTSTAPIRLFQINKLDAWYCLEQLARLLLDFLPMNKVTGIMVSYRKWQCSHILIPVNIGEELANVFYFLAESPGSLSIGRIITEQMIVLLEC